MFYLYPYKAETLFGVPFWRQSSLCVLDMVSRRFNRCPVFDSAFSLGVFVLASLWWQWERYPSCLLLIRPSLSIVSLSLSETVLWGRYIPYIFIQPQVLFLFIYGHSALTHWVFIITFFKHGSCSKSLYLRNLIFWQFCSKQKHIYHNDYRWDWVQ